MRNGLGFGSQQSGDEDQDQRVFTAAPGGRRHAILRIDPMPFASDAAQVGAAMDHAWAGRQELAGEEGGRGTSMISRFLSSCLTPARRRQVAATPARP